MEFNLDNARFVKFETDNAKYIKYNIDIYTWNIMKIIICIFVYSLIFGYYPELFNFLIFINNAYRI